LSGRRTILQGAEQFEPELQREPLGKFMAYAVLFHVLLVAGGLGFALLSNLFPHDSWGGANDGGAIAVQLVSSALPLPADRPPNNQVLATQKPSEAPAPPAPKAKATVDETAIPIATKVEEKKKPAEKKQEESKPLKPVPTQTASNGSPHTQPTKVDNKATYGEQQASAVQRSMQPQAVSTNGQTAVTSGARGFNYPYYVENIQRKMKDNLYRGEVDPRTPPGARTYILFTVNRDGTPANARLDKSSGSPTLDQACVRAARRVDTFGPLPSPPGDGNLQVSYYCDYSQ
jgi:protein TonB